MHFDLYRFAKNIVCTISALVIGLCPILGELKFLKNLKQQVILHVFIKNLYLKINT